MGTKADFYIGRGKHAEYIGSCGMDGDPRYLPSGLFSISSETDFRDWVSKIPSGHNLFDIAYGWPWSWETSADTDFAYSLFEGKVWVSRSGSDWFDGASLDWEGCDIRSCLRQANYAAEAVFPTERDILERRGLTKRQSEQLKAQAFNRMLARQSGKFDDRPSVPTTGRPKSFMRPLNGN